MATVPHQPCTAKKMRFATALLLAISLSLCAIAQDEAPKQADPPGEEETYIPKDLDDAVRELNKLIQAEDKELIKKGEIDSGDMHFGLGRGLRNSWGLWGGSRLAVYFKEQGITHPDSMSGYILDAFCRDLRGQKHDLLSIFRANAKDGPTYQQPLVVDGEPQEGTMQAVLFREFNYDKKKRVVTTSLLWNPDDGKTYLEVGSDRRLAEEQEIKQFRELKEGWNFTTEEEEILAGLRSATPEERLEQIKRMTVEQSLKFDGLLSRAKDPEGLDKEPDDPFFDPFAEPNPEAEPDGAEQPATAPKSKSEGKEISKPDSEECPQ